jgi:hypothetical protein
VEEPKITTRELTDDEIEDRLLAALRGRAGQVTESDLVVASGLAPQQVGPGVRRLLVQYRSSLAVTADGQLLYRFDPQLVRRDARPWAFLKSVLRAVWQVFALCFKVLTGLVLLVYVGVFVLLLLLVFEADVLTFGDGAVDALKKPHRLRRLWQSIAGACSGTLGFARNVFAFIFGPPQVKPDEFADERELLAFVRAREGVITPAEIIAQTGWPSSIADQESTRLVARYGGDVEIENGQVLYTFAELMASTQADVAACPPPCWERLETPVDLTGNSTNVDWLIAGVNAYVLVAATVLMPLVFANQLNMDLSVPWLRHWLVEAPALYSVTAFAIWALRREWMARPENQQRAQRNLRRLLLREAFHNRNAEPAALAGELAKSPTPTTAAAVEKMAESMAIELGAQIDPGDDGRLHFSWQQLLDSQAAATVRRSGRRARVLSAGRPEVIFSTDASDGPAQA